MTNCGWCGDEKAVGDHAQCVPPLRALAQQRFAAARAAADLMHDEAASAEAILAEPHRLLRPEYRDMIERLYRQAEVPSDSGGGMQANLRYHLWNALRKVAPAEDLEALGMAVEGPLARIRTTRQAAPAGARRAVRPGVGDPAALASLALDAVRTLRTMEPGAEVEPVLRKVLDEILDVLPMLSSVANHKG